MVCESQNPEEVAEAALFRMQKHECKETLKQDQFAGKDLQTLLSDVDAFKVSCWGAEHEEEVTFTETGPKKTTSSNQGRVCA